MKDMLHECDERKGGSCTGNSTGYDGIHLIYAGGHCHAPSCISMELFNADTGKRLCHHAPVYGTSDEVNLISTQSLNQNGKKQCKCQCMFGYILQTVIHVFCSLNVFKKEHCIVGYKSAFRSHVFIKRDYLFYICAIIVLVWQRKLNYSSRTCKCQHNNQHANIVYIKKIKVCKCCCC